MAVSSDYGKIFQEIDISRHELVPTVLPATTHYKDLLNTLLPRVDDQKKAIIQKKFMKLNISLIALEQSESKTIGKLFKLILNSLENGVINPGEEFDKFHNRTKELFSFYVPPRPLKQSAGTIIVDNFKKFALSLLEKNVILPQHKEGLEKQIRWTLQKQANPPEDLAKIV